MTTNQVWTKYADDVKYFILSKVKDVTVTDDILQVNFDSKARITEVLILTYHTPDSGLKIRVFKFFSDHEFETCVYQFRESMTMFL